jgi:hypothetical protein
MALLVTPPLTEDCSPLAMFAFPPLTEAKSPLAVLLSPPLTEANRPLISFNWPITRPPKLAKLSPSPAATLCEPVRLSAQNGSVDPAQKGNSWRD